MAKRKQKGRYVKVAAGLRVPKSLTRSVAQFARTPLGKVIIAEALVLAAGLLARKHPVASAAAAGNAAADMAGTATETVARLMSTAADHLKAGMDAGKPSRGAGSRKAGDDEGRGANPGNGARATWDNLDGDTVRDAVIGDFSGKKRKKNKAKRAKI
jgi:hypothetical protein